MSYKVLYRKYRPNKFCEIVGQKTIVDNLKNSVTMGNFSHAYIFTGPRGTGKTSTAKVLAKAINCTNLNNGEICGECDSCKNFATSPDIIEIDAASNNGVDEIRELRNNITLAPAASKYKVYIIDEVHMLSPGAFNALLKTLEEPPAHAIFILATTEVYKVPITILSRCQRYDFKKIEKHEMIDYLKEICQKEKIDYEDTALEEIYSLSEGCMRDALSILDQISKSEKKLTQEAILKNYNIISNRSIEELLEFTINNDVNELINRISEFENSGMNAQKLIKKIINYLEKIAIDIKLKKENKYNFDFINKLIKSLNECYIDARINENVFTLIKLSFLELCPTSNSTNKNPVKNEKIEQKIEKAQKIPIQNEIKEIKKETQNQTNVVKEPPKEEPTKTKPTQEPKPQKELSLIDIRINNCFAGANKENLKTSIETWQNVTKDKINFLNVENYTPVAASPDYAIFTAEESSLADLFNIKKDDIEKILKKNKLEIKVVALTDETWKQEKEKYKVNIRSGHKYEHIEEPKEIDDDNGLKSTAEGLFTDKLIEIS